MIIAQQVVSGLATGCLYALAALGLVLIYKTLDMVNFAQGEMSMVSTFVAYTLLTRAGAPYPLAFMGAMLFAFVLGFLVDQVFMRPLEGKPVISMMIVTLGLLMVFNGVAGWIWGYNTLQFPSWPFKNPMPIMVTIGSFGPIIFTRHSLLVLGITLGIMGLLYAGMQFTRYGVAMRATAENPVAARLMGVPVRRVYSAAWAISAALGAVAGILIAPTSFLDPNMMAEMNLKGFTAAVLGGFSSLPGAVGGGLVLGVLENLVTNIIPTQWKGTMAFGLIVLVLCIRPSGLFGKHYARKV